MYASDNKKIINIIILLASLYIANSFLEAKKIDWEFIAVQSLIIPLSIMAIVIHEVSHGYAAYALGDNTAKLAGRLSLNPLKHLDPLGILAILIIKIGWAKPVPVNYDAFKKPRRDVFLVAMAGPLANMLIAVFCAFLIKGLIVLFGPQGALSAIAEKHHYALALLIQIIASGGIYINLILMCFNLLPIPPLDGSKLLMCILPEAPAKKLAAIEPYGIYILIALVYFKFLDYFIFGAAEKIYEYFKFYILA